jgi:hypothetical protein
VRLLGPLRAARSGQIQARRRRQHLAAGTARARMGTAWRLCTIPRSVYCREGVPA